MTRFICSCNIERFRRLLENEESFERRAVLEQLLADEEEIWTAFYANARDASAEMPRSSKPL
jgi:hypothetical protein